MMKLRMALPALVCALAFVGGPARAEDDGHRDQNPLRALYRAVAALDARVGKLEGNIEAADLTGTYGFVAIGNALNALVTNVHNAKIDHWVITGTATLNLDGTGSISVTISGVSLTQGSWTLTSGDFSDSQAFGWTYANGVVTATFADGSTSSFNVGPGGRLMVGTVRDLHSAGQYGETDLLILTRL